MSTFSCWARNISNVNKIEDMSLGFELLALTSTRCEWNGWYDPLCSAVGIEIC